MRVDLLIAAAVMSACIWAAGCATTESLTTAKVSEALKDTVGSGTKKTVERRKELLQSLASRADTGDVEAVDELLDWYGTRNTAKYLTWLDKKAELGDPDAALELAELKLRKFEYAQAEKYLSMSSLADNAKANAYLGWLHFRALHSDSSLQKALELFTKSAAQGNGLAHAGLGWMYIEGDVVEKSYDKAYEHFAAGMQSNNPRAIAGMANLYSKQDQLDEAYELAVRAAESDDAVAEGMVASYLFQEAGGEAPRPFYSVSLMKRGRRAGHALSLDSLLRASEDSLAVRGLPAEQSIRPEALERLEQLGKIGRKWARVSYLFIVDGYLGRGELTSYPAIAQKWRDEFANAPNDFNSLNYRLATAFHEKDVGLFKRYAPLQIEYLERAGLLSIVANIKFALSFAESGFVVTNSNFHGVAGLAHKQVGWAMHAIANEFMASNASSSVVTVEEGVRNITRLAQRGYVNPMAWLGWYYDVVEKNSAESVKWTKQAADFDNVQGLVNLGRMYLYGTHKSKDISTAIKYFKKASDLGDLAGSYLYAEALFQLPNPQRHREQISDLLQASAAANSPKETRGYALRALGMIDVQGLLGWNRDLARGAGLYLQAAELGNIDAQAELAGLYEKGIGVPRNMAQARYWYEQASKNGHAGAAAYVAGLPKSTYEPRRKAPRQPAPSAVAVRGAGSGWVSEYGVIVTNHHVIDKATKIIGRINGAEPIELRVVGSNRSVDLALLAPKRGKLTQRGLALAGAATPGTETLAMGYPLLDMLGADIKVTDGIISSTSGLGGSRDEYQITNPVQPGNSGGPLLLKNGKVVAVVSSRIKDLVVLEEAGVLPQNINYAVKSTHVKSLLRAHSKGSNGAIVLGRNANTSDVVNAVMPAMVLIEVESIGSLQ